MAFIPAVNTAKVLIKSISLNQELLNVLWFTFDDVITMEGLTELGELVKAWWIDQMKPLTSLDFDNYEIQAIQQDAADSPLYSTTGAGQGSDTQDPLPGNVALVTTFNTLLRGKSYHGRMYLGGMTVLAMDTANQNDASADYVTALLTAWTNFQNQISLMTHTGQHVVASHFHLGAPRATALTSAVIDYRVNNAFDSQRRRLRGRGK